MSLIKCKECGREVSSAAENCPHCGYPIRANSNDIVRIKIDNDPTCPGYHITIKEVGSGRILATVASGSVAEIKTNKPLTISFSGMSGIPMLTTTVSPENGGKYHATWGAGLFTSRIASCTRVDYIDSSTYY